MDEKFPKKVMVFGVFDRLHAGHISFLQQAARYGDKLIVVVTRDDVVQELKKKIPIDAEIVRKKNVQDIVHVNKAVMGDTMLGSYDVIHRHKPDVICLGYDQHRLQEDLQSHISSGEIPSIEIVMMEPYEAEIFHTSLLTDVR